MGTTSQKIQYLGETKSLIKDSINLTGAGITDNDTFRSYAVKLRDGLLNVLNNGTIVLYNNFPKVNGTGSNISLSNTLEAPMNINKLDGDTLQDGTPTPDTPVEIQSVEGIQNITIGDGTDSDTYEVNLEGKNLFNEIYDNIDTSIRYKSIYVGNGKFTASSSIPLTTPNNVATIFFLAGQVTNGASTNTNGVYLDRPITVESVNGYVTIAYRIYQTYNPEDYKTQIELGELATSYVPYRSPIKLYNGDYITGTPDNWSIVRNNGSVILNGSENWTLGTNRTNTMSFNTNLDNSYASGLDSANGYTSYFIGNTRGSDNDINCFWFNPSGAFRIRIEKVNLNETSVDGFKNWLSTHNTEVVYKLATPTTTSITDTYLISQLNALYNAKSYNGQTNISVSGNLPMILEVSALKDEI